jgi:arylsulfatase A-like enzyme
MKYILILVTFSVVNLSMWGQKQNKRPNFLFIMVDDQSPFDLNMYDSKSILETPTLDKLAKGGMIFESAHHMGSMNGAVCAPSRHMIMSGRTVWHLPPSATYQKQKNPHPIDDQTIGAVFNRAGYNTMRTCKQGNSYFGANKQFTVIKDATKRGGTTESGSAWHAKQVLEYLNARETTKKSKPFFIYYGFSHPHDERNGTPKLLKKYGAVNHTNKNSLPPSNPKQPQLQDNYLVTHPFFHGHPNLRDEERVPGVWKNRDEQTIRNELGREYACSENIDIQIDKVLKKLKKMGELENTYVIYTSDHGIAIGRHGLTGKQNLYEHTWRVPFIINGPGIKAGTRVEGNIYLSDILPTLCDLADVKIPKTVEGKSFKSILEGKETAIRETMFGVYCGGSKPGMRSVKKGDWKLIKYDLMDGTVRKTQLFNLKENPNEFLIEHHDSQITSLTGVKPKANQINLADDPTYASKRKEMEDLLLKEMKKWGDPYRMWDQPKKPKRTKEQKKQKLKNL